MTEVSDPAAKAKKSRIRKGHWIPVVAGFLRKDGKILVGQRPENNSLPGQWEFQIGYRGIESESADPVTV